MMAYPRPISRDSGEGANPPAPPPPGRSGALRLSPAGRRVGRGLRISGAGQSEHAKARVGPQLFDRKQLGIVAFGLLLDHRGIQRMRDGPRQDDHFLARRSARIVHDGQPARFVGVPWRLLHVRLHLRGFFLQFFGLVVRVQHFAPQRRVDERQEDDCHHPERQLFAMCQREVLDRLHVELHFDLHRLTPYPVRALCLRAVSLAAGSHCRRAVRIRRCARRGFVSTHFRRVGRIVHVNDAADFNRHVERAVPHRGRAR